MIVAVSGSHGLIGSALLRQLVADGHEVRRIVRGGADGGAGAVAWDPAAGTIDTGGLEGVDAVVHLAGAGLASRRWTPSYKATVVDSRVGGTSLLAGAVASLRRPPAVMVSASAVGYYGPDRGDEVLTEASDPGGGFLADLCRRWEAATSAAADAGVRVAHLRTGIVLSAAGGALRAQLPVFRLGLGGRLGDGSAWFSWVTRADAVVAITSLLADDGLDGPFNITAPDPVTNAGFTKALARTLRRPAFLRVPKTALRLALGREMADETVLSGQRALPRKLLDAGHRFHHPDLTGGLEAALADRAH